MTLLRHGLDPIIAVMGAAGLLGLLLMFVLGLSSRDW